MDPKDELRKRVDEGKAGTQAIWETMTRRHGDYVRVLELSLGDVNELKKQKGHIGMYPTIEDELESAMLSVDIDGETFGLVVKSICGIPYGGKWTTCLMLGCKSNPALNLAIGHGTTLIFNVPEDWHNRVISRLTEKDAPPPT